MANRPDVYYAFIIDTDSYSGNFEREMAAFLTGVETVRGEKWIEEFEKEYGKNDEDSIVNNLLYLYSEHGDEFQSIWESPNWRNDGNGKHYPKNSAKGKKCRYAAYNSVAIFFRNLPDEQSIAMLKERAYKFVQLSSKIDRENINIEKFRIIKIETQRAAIKTELEC